MCVFIGNKRGAAGRARQRNNDEKRKSMAVY